MVSSMYLTEQQNHIPTIQKSGQARVGFWVWLGVVIEAKVRIGKWTVCPAYTFS